MFTIKIFEDKHAGTVARVIGKIREVIRQYVSGLLIETGCVAVLNSIGLLIIGAPYAIAGVIGSILNLIPYIGGLISLGLTAIVTLSNTGDTFKALGSMAVFLSYSSSIIISSCRALLVPA